MISLTTRITLVCWLRALLQADYGAQVYSDERAHLKTYLGPQNRSGDAELHGKFLSLLNTLVGSDPAGRRRLAHVTRVNPSCTGTARFSLKIFTCGDFAGFLRGPGFRSSR